MATVTVRNLSEATRRALKARAASNDRSMEAEAREILERAVHGEVGPAAGWLEATQALRGEFVTPTRGGIRDVDVS